MNGTSTIQVTDCPKPNTLQQMNWCVNVNLVSTNVVKTWPGHLYASHGDLKLCGQVTPFEVFTNSPQYKNDNIRHFCFSCVTRNLLDHQSTEFWIVFLLHPVISNLRPAKCWVDILSLEWHQTRLYMSLYSRDVDSAFSNTHQILHLIIQYD